MNIRLDRAARAAFAILVCLLASVGAAGAQSINVAWLSVDVGNPALAGSARLSNNVFTITAGGKNISGTSDQFHFVHQTFSGDFDIRARVDLITAANPWSKAGVMVRSSLAADASYAYALTSALQGTGYQRRLTNKATSTFAAAPGAGAPVWVRLVRQGSVVTAYTSPNNSHWTRVGSDTIALGTKAYAGIAVTSADPAVRTKASVSNPVVTKASFPAGQSSIDIGAPAVRGSAVYSDGRYTVTGTDADIWDSADQFHFVYQPAQGDLDVVARIETLTTSGRSSKAGIMIRESLSASSTHASALVSSGKAFAFIRRPATGSWSEHTSGGIGTPPRWMRLVRTGTLFEAYQSSDGTNWTRIGSDAIAMGNDVFVGIAVSGSPGQIEATAVVNNFRVTAAAPAGNQAPVVTLTSPLNAQSFVSPTSVTLSAAASDADGNIVCVDFYAGSTLLGRDTAAPYTSTVSLPPGSYAIKAVAIDDQGASTASQVATISVVTSVMPTAVAFDVASDHSTTVTSYVLEVYHATAKVGTDKPLATSSLGKPTPVQGSITLDRSAFFAALAPGNYVAAIVAVGSGGSTRSAPVSFSR